MAELFQVEVMRLQQRKAQLAAWEAMIIIMLIGYGGYMTYLWASKITETKVFQKGSNARIWQPEAHLGCNNLKVDEYYEGKLHAIVNKT